MAELSIYTVTVNGNETTMQLSEEDAKRLNAKPVEKVENKPAEKEQAKAVTAPPKHKARSVKGN
jgi:hypothetical protein